MKHENSTVIEYEMKFASLASLVASQLTDDIFKDTCFKAVLRPNVCLILAIFPIIGNSDRVTRSIAIEAKAVELRREYEASAPIKNISTGLSQQ